MFLLSKCQMVHYKLEPISNLTALRLLTPDNWSSDNYPRDSWFRALQTFRRHIENCLGNCLLYSAGEGHRELCCQGKNCRSVDSTELIETLVLQVVILLLDS